jgi:hypothetical protein
MIDVKAEFLKSSTVASHAVLLAICPNTPVVEVMWGIADQSPQDEKNLAKPWKPGRRDDQSLHYHPPCYRRSFLYLADLPGYGYAKVSNGAMNSSV